MEETLELALKKIADLERRLEKYFEILYIENELDFILKGNYVFDSEIDKILSGEYTV